MTELDEILSKMDDDLFKDDKNPDKNMQGSVSRNITSVHQEDIPNEIAKTLLDENQFEDDCHYQMISMQDSTVILKIKNGDETVTTEYTLSSDDSMQSYEEMKQDVLGMNIRNSSDLTNFRDIYESPKSRWWIIPTILFVTLAVIGCSLIYFVLNIQ